MTEAEPLQQFNRTYVRRCGRFPFDPQARLRGEGLPLEPGDTVEIHPHEPSGFAAVWQTSAR